jgi:hypothetical protein
MKRFLAVLALTCVISATALAGHIDTCGAPAPLPGDVDTAGVPAPGDQGNGDLALLILDLLF